MGILWWFSAHSNPISAAVGSDGMGMVWSLATHSNPITAAECLDGNAMGWCEIRSSSIVVALGFGMEQSHTIPIVDAMGMVWSRVIPLP